MTKLEVAGGNADLDPSIRKCTEVNPNGGSATCIKDEGHEHEHMNRGGAWPNLTTQKGHRKMTKVVTVWFKGDTTPNIFALTGNPGKVGVLTVYAINQEEGSKNVYVGTDRTFTIPHTSVKMFSIHEEKVEYHWR
jgi:hypothetical protein